MVDWRAGPGIWHHGRAAGLCPKQSRVSGHEDIPRIGRGWVYSRCDVHFVMLVHERGAHEAHCGILLWDVWGHSCFAANRCRVAITGRQGWIIGLAVDFSRCGLSCFDSDFHD